MILVVLAAGMGSRYGGLKQMDVFDSHGTVLLDYSVFDALRSGFDTVVFVLRHAIEQDFYDRIISRMEGKVRYRLAFQEYDSFIPPDINAAAQQVPRTKPWGTLHALLCAQSSIDAPFAVINADDFYGREAFNAMGSFLSQSTTEGAIVPFPVGKTLSSQGTVARALCIVEQGYLKDIEEMTNIAAETDGRIFNTHADGSKTLLLPDAPISMNIWGFQPTVFNDIKEYFEQFLRTIPDVAKSECYLPSAVQWLIQNRSYKIRVIEAHSEWFGVTYRNDREEAKRRISTLIAQGIYPQQLWK